jgi:hypothetical protein
MTHMNSISAEQKISPKLSTIIKNNTRLFDIHVDNIATSV